MAICLSQVATILIPKVGHTLQFAAGLSESRILCEFAMFQSILIVFLTILVGCYCLCMMPGCARREEQRVVLKFLIAS